MNRIVLCLALACLLQACGSDQDKNNASANTSATAGTGSKPGPNQAGVGVTIREATERLFQNPYDTEAVYFISQTNGTPEALSVLIKRVSKDGTQYSRWLFNCNDHTAQNLGVSASIQALDDAAHNMPSKSQPYELKSKLGAVAQAVCK